MKKIQQIIVLIFFFISSYSVNGRTLDDVKKRGFLKCGVSTELIGFASINDKAEWSGFDVDICRAVASAIFGDSDKVEFTTTTSRSRFPILASGEIDMLARNTTWSFSRDVNLGFEFVGINFYDGQGFLVPKSLEIRSALELDGASICVEIDTTKGFNLTNYFQANEISYKSVMIELNEDAIENYKVGRCDVYSTVITDLALLRSQLSNPSEHIILPEIISREPLGPLVRHGDHEWGDIIRWSLNAMIIAEELGLTKKNIDSHLDSNNKEVLRLIGVEGNFGDMLELDYKWAYNIIKQVGDYGSVFDKNIGPNTFLGLNRGLNALWSQGGILYAPPFK
jgi:general L-amino acid transport system substrate-binding protein